VCGRWSVVECVEHVVMGEEVMFASLSTAAVAAPARNESRERAILERGGNRERRVAAPLSTLPAARFASLAEAWRHFFAARARTQRFVRDCPRDLRALAATHPIFGPLNGYELLLLMAVHPLRHAYQIREIRAGDAGLRP